MIQGAYGCLSGSGGSYFMWIWMGIVFLLIATFIVLLIKKPNRDLTSHHEQALLLLDEKLATGALSEKEYQTKKRIILENK